MGSTPSSGILSHGERTVERMDRGLAVAIFVKEGERLGISISKSLSGSKEEGRSIALGHGRLDVYRLAIGLGIDSDSDPDSDLDETQSDFESVNSE